MKRDRTQLKMFGPSTPYAKRYQAFIIVRF